MTRPTRPSRRPGRLALAGLTAALALSPVIGSAPAVLADGATKRAARTVPEGEPHFAPLPQVSLNFYGSPGIVDMPSGEMLPDGQFTTGISYFGGQGRYTLTFQAAPWLSASFRYLSIQNWNMGGFSTYYDRNFDVRFRLLKEGRRWPEITVGLQDLAGTGIYSAEYIAATKTFATPALGGGHKGGRLKLTAGLGWGRLGSAGAIGSTGTRPPYDPNSQGGELSADQWFRGDFAPFAGIEWQANDKLGLKLEYSSDAYVTETQVASVFDKKSRMNFGVEYQATPATRLGAYYLYGSEIGFNAQIQLNPKHPTARMAVPAPNPIRPRPSRAADPEAWDTDWTASATIGTEARDVLAPELRKNGLVLESLTLRAHEAELRFRNLRYKSFANAVGRAARVMAQILPASVETFRLVPEQGGMALSAVTVRRSDLEALEFDPNATEALLAVTGIGDAPVLAADAVPAGDLYPAYSWSLEPYFSPGYFDPDRPFRIDVGLALRGNWQPAPGWLVSGQLRQRLAGNLANGKPSNSVLPHVRTDQAIYAEYDSTMQNLYVSRQWRAGPNLYARLTGGYLETMYGGISGEVLWKPVGSRLGLGVEANYVRQRDYDQRFGFRDYSVATGHASAYYEFGDGYLTRVDVGRYLAGDVGATFSLDRVFDNGWSVGGFFTLTDVSSEEFGEGSFDKGIRFSIPVGWLLGKPSRQNFGTTIRPIQRDGGQKVYVPGRLYGQVRDAHRQALEGQWARAWE